MREYQVQKGDTLSAFLYKKAKEKVDKLKLLDLPPEIRAKEIRRIIEEIKLR